jgi:SAM-dependent methyltransferase
MSRSCEAPTFNCRLCFGTELELYYRQGNDGRFRYYKCNGCGLVNLDLSAGIDQSQYTDTWVDPRDDSSRQNRENDASFEFISRYVPSPGWFLDIGCGHGRLLYRAHKAGWQVKGIELSPETAVRVAAELDVPVRAGDFLTMPLDPEDTGRYDLISLRHVIEHLPDSRLAMNRIRAMLAKDGKLLLEMPNIEAWDKRLKRWLVSHGLYRRRFSEDFVAGHCNEFCLESLSFLLKETGFRLLRWETYSKKAIGNVVFNRFPIGNKARALVQRVD